MTGLWGRMWADWPSYILITFGFTLSATLALAPFTFLVSNLVPDDAFYYFQMARNIAQGLGPTFDGVNLTNGYHPLWLLVLVPIFSSFSSGISPDVVPIHVTLLLSSLLYAASGCTLLRIISRYTLDPIHKAIAVGFWMLNPFVIYEMLSGLETPLSLFLVTLFILCALRISEDKSSRNLIIGGIIGGLMMLARLDNVFYFVALLAFVLYHNGFKFGIHRVLLLGIVATIIVAPWLIWNWLTFDMVLTSSSVAFTLVNHALIVQEHGASFFQTLKAAVYSTDYYIRMMMTQTAAPSIVFLLVGAACAWRWFDPDRNRRLFSQFSVIWFLFAGFVFEFVVNASIRFVGRTWYFIPINIFVVILLAWFLGKLSQRMPFPKKTIAIIVCLTLALFYINWSKNLRDRQIDQLQILAASQWIDENLPQESQIGVFNAGIHGYVSNHRIINLDGLVNNAALEALKERDLYGYIKDTNIEYVADFPYFSYRYKSFFGDTDILANISVIHTTDPSDAGVRIYKVQ